MQENRQTSENRKKRGTSPVFAGVMLAIIIPSYLLLMILGSLLTNSYKYVTAAINSVSSLRYTVAETTERNNAITDNYYQSTMNTLVIAERLYSKGVFAAGTGVTRKIFGSQHYCVTDPTMDHIFGKLDMTGNDREEIQSYINLMEVEGTTEFYTPLFSEKMLFIRKMQDGDYIFTLKDLKTELRLTENLVDVHELIASAEDQISFVIAAHREKYYAGPARMSHYIGSDIFTLMQVPVPFQDIEDEYNLKFAITLFEGRPYYVIEAPIEDMDTCLYSMTDILNVIRQSMTLGIAIALLVMVGVFIVMYFIYQFRKYHKDDRETRRELRSRTAILILAALTVTGIVTYYAHTLQSISTYILDDEEELQKIKDEYAERSSVTEEIQDMFTRIYSEETRVLANYLSVYPEERTEADLKYFAEEFGFEYLVLFDNDGKEIRSSADYINLSLSKNRDDMSWKFRSLLNGVQLVSSGIEMDDLTLLRHQVIGAQLRNAANEPDGFLMAAYSPTIVEKAISASSIEAILNAEIQLNHNIFFRINPETKEIIYSPYDLTSGINALDAGFTETSLMEGFSGSLNYLGTKYSVTQTTLDQEYLYIGMAYDTIFENRMQYTGLSTVGALVVYLIAALLMSHVRMQKAAEAAEAETEENVLFREKSEGRSLIAEEKTTKMILNLARLIGIILVIVLLFRKQILAKDSMILYVLQGDWRPGPNVFALTAVLIMILVVGVLVRIVISILDMFSRIVSPRAETYIRLVRSTVTYMSVLITGYVALMMFGVKMQTLLATTSIMALLVGMGAQDLTEDIIAGLFLMFESEFQVGDVIDVDGKIGVVKEIGIHSTKMIDQNNNILLLNNARVKNIINRTQNTSYTFSSFTLSTDIPIRRLEEIFAKELPLLKERYPQFVSAPYFMGAGNFDGGRMECTIAAEASEENRLAMERILNMEIQKILKKYEIEIG